VTGGRADGASPTDLPEVRGPVEVAMLSGAPGESWLTIADVDGLIKRGFGARVLEEPHSQHVHVRGNGES